MSRFATAEPAALARRSTRRERLGAYKELGKLYVFDQYLGVPVA